MTPQLQTADEKRKKAYAMIMRERMNLLTDGTHPATLFFATLLLKLPVQYEPEKGCSTFATDGRKMVFHEDFVLSLSPPQLRGVLIHEVLHCALGHVWSARGGGKKELLWNVACDLVVNSMIGDMARSDYELKNLYDLPPGGVSLDDAPFKSLGYERDKSAEYYYEKIVADLSQDAFPDYKDPGGMSPPPEGEGEGEGEGGQGDDYLSDEDEWQEAMKEGARRAQAQENGDRLAGSLPGSLARIVSGLLKRRPPDPWAALRDFMTRRAVGDYSWVPPSRKWLSQGHYLPGNKSDQIGHVLIAFDTSGSMGRRELDLLAAMIEELRETYSCPFTVLYHDTKVHGEERWLPGDGEVRLSPKGGGGTSHECVARWLKNCSGVDERSGEGYCCCVMMTDAYTSYPDEKDMLGVPVLWFITPGGNSQDPPFGKCVRVP